MSKKVKIPGSLREQILKRDGYKCNFCQEDKEKLIVHMITPASRGGDLSAKNLITLCERCIPKPMIKSDEKREQIGASVNPLLVKWVDKMVEKGFFRNRSHGVEESIAKYKEFVEHGEIRRILP